MTVRFRPATPADAAAIRTFERENAAWFARWVPPRAPDYLDPGVLEAELSSPGARAFHLLLEDGRVLGRANLLGLRETSAYVGYRLAEAATGRGLGHVALGHLIAAARDRGLRQLLARCRTDNPASRRILVRGGFNPDGQVTTAPFGRGTVTLLRLSRPL